MTVLKYSATYNLQYKIGEWFFFSEQVYSF